MEIISASINWYERYVNNPVLKIETSEAAVRGHNDFVYEEKDGCYFAEKDGFVSFFYYQAPGEGFGGSHFTLNMKDGTKKTLIGPWSSRAGAMNCRFEQQCLDVVYNNNLGGACTLETAQEAIKWINDHKVYPVPVYLVRVDDGDTRYDPSISPTKVVKYVVGNQTSA